METSHRDRRRRSWPYSTEPLSASRHQTPFWEPEMATDRVRPLTIGGLATLEHGTHS
jgi:hypothetical protein